MWNALWIFVGGGLGSLARWGVSGWIANTIGETFPWGTLLVNISGSFVIGLFATVTGPEGRWGLAPASFRQFFMLGICGGYQMLGQRIDDPLGIEGPPRSVAGLGLLDVMTRLSPTKTLQAVAGVSLPDGVAFSGYEMHVGETDGPATGKPFARLSDGRPEGAASADGRVAGAYIHGLFGDDRQRAHWLRLLGAGAAGLSYEASVDDALNRLAAHLAEHIDCDRLLALAG